jgi:DNA recombination protein RmuC
MEYTIALVLALVIGFILGVGAAYLLRVMQSKTAQEIAGNLFQESEARRQETVNVLIDNLKGVFGSLSLEALSKSTEQFMLLAKQKLEEERGMNAAELDKKKTLIDQQLQSMTEKMDTVSKLVQELEKDRENKFGEITKQLELTGRQTQELIKTTGTLREALASSKIRGQWGERMAEDVLRVAGFIENIQYEKQQVIEGIGNKPDFTFKLPRNRKLNMDVKFPFENYIRFLEADSDPDREKYRKTFLKDVRNRIQEITTREYINPEQNTLDYVLLFIPNEQIYAFINEQDQSIIDESIEKKVIICSPITLFAVLAVIRQAVDNFTFEKTSNEILVQLARFQKQWEYFCEGLSKLGKRIEDSQKEYDTLMSTRKRQIEKPLQRIEEIRKQQGILPVENTDDGTEIDGT